MGIEFVHETAQTTVSFLALVHPFWIRMDRPQELAHVDDPT